MSSRRSFLGQLTRAAIGVGLLGFSPLVPRLYAIAPAVVIAIVQAAVTVASLFSKRGDPQADQAAMLAAVEKELEIVEQDFQEILRRLDELKQLTLALPEEVVKEGNKTLIYGLGRKYAEIEKVYYAEGTLTPQNQKQLDDWLLGPLQQARNQLMGLPQPQFALVPIMCYACYVESKAMAMDKEGTTAAQRRVARNSYREWLVTVSRGKSDTTLEGKIAALRSQQLYPPTSNGGCVGAGYTNRCTKNQDRWAKNSR